ncbi:hypothetical protein NQ318_015553 [Aromia moschata]|uniref:Translin-associated factor X-interacting protein 1 N-terminal domain-containing protein n=1 Tax=Aromia moschata TaxID=1265417 RepID=A0AAV8XKF0_9CUCU|nr:hypothetical protein NQ318_015553 [Aromia moschata]
MSNSESSASHVINAQEDGKTDASSSSLLSLLDDKNKTIATLQKRLENQKEQLSYYLKRELSVPKIVRLSESCEVVRLFRETHPDLPPLNQGTISKIEAQYREMGDVRKVPSKRQAVVDDDTKLNLLLQPCSPRAPLQSVAVSMAMSRFGKPLGVRSELCALYERARAADGGVAACLRDQEFVLRKVVTKLCEFVKYANGGHDFGLQFSNFIAEPRHLELFGGLLRATARLRRKLDTFRICCDRLLVAEDERNAIAEQIYSVPAEQRVDNNYLIGVQMEKMQLENEIKQILRDQGEDRERIKEITVIEEKLSNLQRQLNSAFARNDGGNPSYAVKFCVKLNKTPKDTYNMLKDAFGDVCMSYSQTKKWHKSLREGREDVNDEARIPN